MADYDFRILNPNEFECLTRDLLQKRENIFIESFTPGRDQGIDLRFASATPRGTAIVQAKRYKDYNSLLRILKQEVVKVKRLNPKRYILSTSVGLTPENKEEIIAILSPYIVSESDILGREDLNNLLGQYKDIELQYYKLWIASTNVLDRIINRGIENWSGFEREEIERDIASYVMNDSFNEAMSILLKNRFVIISGIPGIGKTTLSRMLIYKLLGEDYEEVIRISSMEDAAEKMIDGRRQIFFFDDFLGANYFHVTEDGFEGKVLRFIDAIKRRTGKLFIMSTREYILKSALMQYEHFAIRNIELAKCTIDMEDYSEDVRAHILYNHLAEANIPIEYVRPLLMGSQYLKIIKHQNFNPRIIEAFLNKQLYQQVTPTQFVQHFLNFFDHPDSVWDYAFGRMLKLPQYALFVRMTMGNTPVYLNDWYLAVKCFVIGTYNELHLSITEQSWEEILKLMEGTFILTSRCQNSVIANFQNPSVFDFLLDKVRRYEEVQGLLIKNSYYADQVYNSFSDLHSTDTHQKIRISINLHPDVIFAYRRSLNDLRICEIKELYSSFKRESVNVVSYILKMQDSFPELSKNNHQLVEDTVTQDMLECDKYYLMDRMSLLARLDEDFVSRFDLEHLAVVAYSQAEFADDFVNIMDLLERTKYGQDVIVSDEMLKRVEDSLDFELESASNEEECDMIWGTISVLAEKIPGISQTTWECALEEARGRFQSEPDYDVDEDWARESYYHSRASEDKTYNEMFSSLLEH